MGTCIALVTLFHFFTLTNFFWMLVEGLYLYMLVVKTFSGDNLRFNIYASIGWGKSTHLLLPCGQANYVCPGPTGGPAFFVVTWAVAKSLTVTYSSTKNVSLPLGFDQPIPSSPLNGVPLLIV